MKKYMLFTLIFSVAFVVLETLYGVVLMWLYTPSTDYMSASTMDVESSRFIPLVIGILSLFVAFSAMKLFKKSVLA